MGGKSLACHFVGYFQYVQILWKDVFAYKLEKNKAFFEEASLETYKASKKRDNLFFQFFDTF